MNQIKENKNSFETSFKSMQHKIKTSSDLELLECKMFFLNFFTTYQYLKMKE